MPNYTKIVQEIAQGWRTCGNQAVKSQAEIVKETIDSLFHSTSSRTFAVGDTIELSMKKYLDEFCNIFKEGNYTIISHKKGGIVDVSKIGELNRNGTVIRYNSAKQAEEEAKKILMKQFDLPLEQQRELCLVTRDKDLFLNTLGDAHESSLPSVINDINIPKRELKIFHNHPINALSGKSYPLSLQDIYTFASDNIHSMTAFNKLGEYNTVVLKEPIGNPIFISQYILRTLQDKLEPILGKNIIPSNNPPDLYCQELHKAYKELLSQFNIEYTTNYSYLTNL